MYLPSGPKARHLDVFSAMPEQFRRRGSANAWVAANRGGLATDSFLEGAVFDASGNLYVTDIPYGRIFRIDPSGG